jgi:16S rRNA (guanine966-N2)-methyltransferase
VREALFNILGTTFLNGRVLDLFAGSGALGIEALSRGAKSISFVERNPKSLRLLKQNLQRLPDVAAEVRIFPADVFKILPKFSREEEKFDLILIDPPYQANLWLRVLQSISQLTLLAATGQIVLEISKYAHLQEQVESLVRVDKRVYGEISLEFWKYKTNGADC